MKVIVLFVLILGFFASVGNSLVEERVLRRVFSGVGHFFQNMAQLKKIKDNSDDLRGYMREISQREDGRFRRRLDSSTSKKTHLQMIIQGGKKIGIITTGGGENNGGSGGGTGAGTAQFAINNEGGKSVTDTNSDGTTVTEFNSNGQVVSVTTTTSSETEVTTVTYIEDEVQSETTTTYENGSTYTKSTTCKSEDTSSCISGTSTGDNICSYDCTEGSSTTNECVFEADSCESYCNATSACCVPASCSTDEEGIPEIFGLAGTTWHAKNNESGGSISALISAAIGLTVALYAVAVMSRRKRQFDENHKLTGAIGRRGKMMKTISTSFSYVEGGSDSIVVI